MEIKTLLFRIKCYKQYLSKSVNAHGLHSPFMFTFYNEVFKYKGNKRLKREYATVFQSLKSFYKNEAKLTITSVGAVGKSKVVNPCNLLSKTKLSPKYNALLVKLIKYLQLNEGLELGTSLGLTACSLSVHVNTFTSLEGNKSVYNWFQGFLNENPQENIQHIHTTFTNYFECLASDRKFDFVFLDGDHTKEATLKNIERIKPHLSDNAVLVVDDINWSEGMAQAWQIAKTDSFFNYTAETFRLGFLFKKPALEKQHFVLRY